MTDALRRDLATSIGLARDAREQGLRHAVAAHLRVIRETRTAIRKQRNPGPDQTICPRSLARPRAEHECPARGETQHEMSTKKHMRQCAPGLAPRSPKEDAVRNVAASPRSTDRHSESRSPLPREGGSAGEPPEPLSPVQSLGDAELKHAIRELSVVLSLQGAGEVRLRSLKAELERRREKRRGEETAR
ncbi:hypothetical protein OKA04_12720 [Luteolibacter flavescens]|uniref:Uncharacterized protein n=1 Tax=Luteolibacter flavescens TaxID=1859460 RepID=A0ABT3FPU5_9BACT|nr:hypothetical protein [Luteolibacter flavescens]MCW1885594.1 hypothetical protein [Luteolibacter flavescens]